MVRISRGFRLNVLLISTNQNRRPIPVLPLGACVVAEAAEKAGHHVKLLDLMFTRNSLNLLERELRSLKPDVVGISLRNIDNNDILHPQTFFGELRFITEMVHRESNAEIVLGGAAVAVMPKQLLAYSGASYAVLGDGEAVFPEILSSLEAGIVPSKISGIGWFDGNNFIQNSLNRPFPSEQFVLPDFHRWLDMNSYRTGFTTIPVQTKRGCPFNCIYCTYSISEGKEYRLNNLESVVEGIRKYCSRGWRDIEFVDNVFNSPPEQAQDLCDLISRSGLKPRLQTMDLNPKFIDSEILSAMYAAGFVGMGITAESVSDAVLEKLGKNYTSMDIYHSADCVRSQSIPCFWIFMLGGPGETKKTVLETIAFAKKFIRKGDTAFFNIGIRIYPSTRLEAIAREEGILNIPEDEMLTPTFYVSPQVETKWLIRTIASEVNNTMSFISQETLALPYLAKLLSTLRIFGVSQPAWKYTGNLRRTLKFIGVKT
jgi:radical SAM superfamily enzyme YgiQ (UPF0313 family)